MEELDRYEANLFKSLAKSYETKNYSSGLINADKILKKYPNHAETLSMKGLLLNSIGKKEEAHNLCRLGLMKNIGSQIAWHCYGLIYRSDKDYKEASKAYLRAIQIAEDKAKKDGSKPHNVSAILRDLSYIQIQLNDYINFAESRRKILIDHSEVKQNWIAYAVGCYKSGQVETALRVLEKFETVNPFNHEKALKEYEERLKLITENELKNNDEKLDLKRLQMKSRTRQSYKDSEFLLFKNKLLIELNKLDDALNQLNQNEILIVDKLTFLKRKCIILIKLNRFDEALDICDQIIKKNTEDYESHRLLQIILLNINNIDDINYILNLKSCDLPSSYMNLNDNQILLLKNKYNDLNELYPKSYSCIQIPFTFLKGNELKLSLKKYIKKQIIRGLPSLSDELSVLYKKIDNNTNKIIYLKDPYDIKNNENFNIIMNITNELIDELNNNNNSFINENNENYNVDKLSSPTNILWLNYLKSQLYEFSGDYKNSLLYINKSIEHTPTSCIMIEKKARILKKSGDLELAANLMDDARCLDLADRYVNNKTVKYLLRINKIEEAQDKMSLFTAHEGDPEYYLYIMQCSWYENELGEAYHRIGNKGLALKKFTAIKKHMSDFINEQFDYHAYCWRQQTFSSYIELLNYNENIYGAKEHIRAIENMINIYIDLIDHPNLIPSEEEEKKIEEEAKKEYELKKEQEKNEENEENNNNNNTSTTNNKKKKKNKKKNKKNNKNNNNNEEKKQENEEKEKEKEKEEEEEEEENKNKKKKKKSRFMTAPLDLDPKGYKLLRKDPYEESIELIKILQKYSKNKIETHLLTYDIGKRKKKPLFALKGLLKANEIDSNNPELLFRVINFFHDLEIDNYYENDDIISSIIEEEKIKLLNNHNTLKSYLDNFINNLMNLSFEHRIGAGIALLEYARGELNHNRINQNDYISLKKNSMELIAWGKKGNPPEKNSDEEINLFNLPKVTFNNCEVALMVLNSNDEPNITEIFRQYTKKLFPLSPIFWSEEEKKTNENNDINSTSLKPEIIEK